MSAKAKLTLTWIAFIVAADQVTKLCVDRWMPLHHSIPVIDGLFSLTYIRNTGAAFGIFAGSAAAFRLPFLIIFSLVAIGFVVTMLRRLPDNQIGLITALAFIPSATTGIAAVALFAAVYLWQRKRAGVVAKRSVDPTVDVATK